MGRARAFTPLEEPCLVGTQIRISNQVSSVRDQGSHGVNKRFLTGFTLVELLVVIAIIALLMSILMPTLARAKKQANAVLCQSNLRQWAIIFSTYTNDYEGYFMPGLDSPLREWMEPLWAYCTEEKMACCPLATKLDGAVHGAKFVAWEWPLPPPPPGTEYFYYGSYGINEFLLTPPPEPTIWGHPTNLNWGQANIKGAANIPLFLDCAWLGGSPTHTDAPPEFDDAPYQEFYGDNMKRFCINRHDGYINGAFLDFSTVRKIGLKELWKLKWHRGYDLNADPPVWPAWMRAFKDY